METFSRRRRNLRGWQQQLLAFTPFSHAEKPRFPLSLSLSRSFPSMIVSSWSRRCLWGGHRNDLPSISEPHDPGHFFVGSEILSRWVLFFSGGCNSFRFLLRSRSIRISWTMGLAYRYKILKK